MRTAWVGGCAIKRSSAMPSAGQHLRDRRNMGKPELRNQALAWNDP